MRKIILLLSMLFSLNVFAYPTTFLEMSSETGDYIGQGLDYYFTESDGAFSAEQAYFGNPTYENNSINIRFIAPGYTDWWYLSFSTHELGIDLIEGSYDAVRFPFEPVGSAGMSVSGNGRGSNQLTGFFTVLDIDFGLNGVINSFAATFEQHSEGLDPALFGKIAFNSNAFNIDEPVTLFLFAIGGIGLLLRRKPGKPVYSNLQAA